MGKEKGRNSVSIVPIRGGASGESGAIFESKYLSG